MIVREIHFVFSSLWNPNKVVIFIEVQGIDVCVFMCVHVCVHVCECRCAWVMQPTQMSEDNLRCWSLTSIVFIAVYAILAGTQTPFVILLLIGGAGLQMTSLNPCLWGFKQGSHTLLQVAYPWSSSSSQDSDFFEACLSNLMCRFNL